MLTKTSGSPPVVQKTATKHRKIETGRFWSGSFLAVSTQRFFFRAATSWILGGKFTRNRRFQVLGPGGAIQVLSRLNEKTHIQLPVDAMYVAKGVTHRSEVGQGPIDELTGNTNIPGVKSHLDDAGAAAIKQKKFEVHANSLADVVAEAPENDP